MQLQLQAHTHTLNRYMVLTSEMPLLSVANTQLLFWACKWLFLLDRSDLFTMYTSTFCLHIITWYEVKWHLVVELKSNRIESKFKIEHTTMVCIGARNCVIFSNCLCSSNMFRVTFFRVGEGRE